MFCGIDIFPVGATWFGQQIIGSFSDLLIFCIGAFVVNDFLQYRKRQRAEAATRILVQLRSCVDYINEISLRKDLYKYEGYYPDKISEIGIRQDKVEEYKERPSRLIANRIFEFKKLVNEPIAQLAGKEAIVLIKLIFDFQQEANGLSNSVGALLGGSKDLANQADRLMLECCDKIMDLKKEIERILGPIVEGHYRCFFWYLSSTQIFIVLMLILLVA